MLKHFHRHRQTRTRVRGKRRGARRPSSRGGIAPTHAKPGQRERPERWLFPPHCRKFSGRMPHLGTPAPPAIVFFSSLFELQWHDACIELNQVSPV